MKNYLKIPNFIPGSSIKIDNLEPELLLFFDVHYKNISEYLDLNFNKFDYGWHITSIENDLLNNEIKKIKHCLKKSNNFPYYFNNYYIDNNLHKELLIFYTNHFSNNYIYKNFLLENKNKKTLEQ